MKAADLFVVDTAINGVDPSFYPDYNPSHRRAFRGEEAYNVTQKRYTELLVRTLYTLNRGAAVLFYGVSTRLHVVVRDVATGKKAQPTRISALALRHSRTQPDAPN